MKATLEFNLPEDQEDFETHLNVWKYRSVIADLHTYLKWELKNAKPAEAKTLGQCWETLHNLLDQQNLEI